MTEVKKAGRSHQRRAHQVLEAERRERTSRLAAAGGLANVSVIATYQGGLFKAEDIDILECRHEVVKRVKQAQDGNTVHVIGLLMAQALALNGIFTKLATQAAQADDHRNPRQMETYLRLALKAQSQSRATLEALVAVGNPPVMFAQQANVAFGPQQVNNGVIPNPRSERNELLEAGDGTRVEPRTTGQASRSDSTVVPLAPVNGTTKR